MSIYIRLFHGREKPDAQLDDWGEDGPIFEADFAHTTYACDLKMGCKGDVEQELSIVNDLVYYNGMFYGDWTVFSKLPEGMETTPYEPEKALVPEHFLKRHGQE